MTWAALDSATDAIQALLNLATAVWLASVGASVGSFVNVVAYRLPLGASIVWIPSRCPRCGYPIRLRDNIPLFGWLILRGRCRDCGVRISPRYFIVETAMAAAFLLLAYVELFSGGANLPGGALTNFTGAWGTIWHPEWELIGVYFYHCALLSVLMAVALIDLDGERAPWKLVGFGIAASLVARYFLPATNVSSGAQLIETLRENSVIAAGVGAACGSVIGALLHYVTRLGPPEQCIQRNSMIAGIIAGSLIGVSIASWLALLSLWCTAWTVQYVALVARPPRIPASFALSLWPAALTLLLFWKPLFEFFQTTIGM